MVKGPVRVLAVDDNDCITQAMGFIFAAPEYAIATSIDGKDALLRIAEETRFDVILVDQNMRGTTGLELVRAIRSRGIDSKIIVISGHVSEEIRHKYEQLDVEIFFPKPFLIHELRSAVDRIAA